MLATTAPTLVLAPVGPPNRNGHAQAIGRIFTRIAATPALDRARALGVCLCRIDEDMLRDADAAQVGEELFVLAAASSRAEWRCGLRRYFRRRYDLTVVFDAVSIP